MAGGCTDRGDMTEALAMGLAGLPESVLYGIVSRLDVPSICAVAASCRLLHLCTEQVVPHMQVIDLQASRVVVLLQAGWLVGVGLGPSLLLR